MTKLDLTTRKKIINEIRLEYTHSHRSPKFVSLLFVETEVPIGIDLNRLIHLHTVLLCNHSELDSVACFLVSVKHK